MKKDEMIKLLKDKYGVADDELVDKNGNFLTNKKLQEMIDEKEREQEETEDYNEEVDIDVGVDVDEEDEIDDFFDISVAKSTQKSFNDNDEITVMSGINGEYIHHSVDSGRAFRFRGFGQTAKIPYKELVSIRNLYPTVLEDGWLVILNKDLIKEFDLQDSYRNVLTPKNSRAIFSKSAEEIEYFVNSLPQAMKVTFVDLARKAYRKGILDKVSTVNAIQELFNISLEDNAPIHDNEE